MDNVSANDVAAGFVRRKVNAWQGSVLGGKYIHVRCGAHIVNLIVHDGLTKLHDSIAVIHNFVRYTRSSPARWNSTYMMFDVALKFERAFARYEEEDEKFLSFFMEKESGKKRIGPPTSTNCECASVFVKFLSTFYKVTLKFSGTLNMTSNNFYHEICEIHSQLTELADANDHLLSIMAVSMKEKYDKYWGNADNINPLLYLVIVLDPRYKIKYLRYCFESVYDSETVARIVVKVESILQLLYTSYNVGSNDANSKDVGADFLSKTSITETRRRRLLENYMQQQQMETAESKSDVDKYFIEETINPMTSSFDILVWWKKNSSRHKILSLIARDVLAVLVSTVASESAFSTSGRILYHFRSWLKGRHDGIKSKEFLDEIHSYAFLEEGNMDKGKDVGAANDTIKAAINVIDE